MRVIKGISFIRRQMPWSVPLITGLWFVAIHILKVGTKLKNSPYKNRAVILSLPVICFIKGSDNRLPCSASVVVINLVPLNRAISFVIWSPVFFINVSVGVAIA